ncbi:MAG: hypothetical protein MSC31_10060 [Solirubrobacteraceae bacterium MAG38_C4-C5]|nr:hypothetical protein [Candidatus Siliceabacter maunaloa]
MTRPQHPSPGLDELVDALLQSYGQLAVILDHMLAHSEHASLDADPPLVVLRRLMKDVLTPMADEADAVATAARTVARVTDTLGKELLLVPSSATPSCRHRQERHVMRRR